MKKDIKFSEDMPNQLNFIYEYKTPFGILKNNLPLDKLSSIFKESLSVYNSEYYESELFNYIKDRKINHKLEFTEINFIHYHQIYVKTGIDCLNFYLIEEFDNNIIINPTYLEALNSNSNYFILLYKPKISDINLFENNIKKFRLENKITRDKIIWISDFQVKKSNEWKYVNFPFSKIEQNDLVLKFLQDNFNRFNFTKII